MSVVIYGLWNYGGSLFSSLKVFCVPNPAPPTSVNVYFFKQEILFFLNNCAQP